MVNFIGTYLVVGAGLAAMTAVLCPIVGLSPANSRTRQMSNI